MKRWGKKRTDGFRSSYEATVAKNLTDAGVEYAYEAEKFPLVRKVVGAKCGSCGAKDILKNGSYTPDFSIKIKGTTARCIVETKGRMTAKDRKTIIAFANLAVSHDCFYFVLLMRDNKITPGSATYYSDWLTKNGITYAVGTTIPPEWYSDVP